LIKNKDAKKIEEILRNLSVKYIIVNYNYNPRDYSYSFLQLKDLIKNIRLIEKCEKFEVYEIY
jgi:signal recognition particle subunit SEC65